MTTDIVILTDKRYLKPKKRDWYIDQVLLEDKIVMNALKKKGFKVLKKSWDDPIFNWNSTNYALFRTTWDYFERYDEFFLWFEKTRTKLFFINNPKLIYWNLDKHYLINLKENQINIPNTIFIEKGEQINLKQLFDQVNWEKVILKPAISGAARETFLISRKNAYEYENDLERLCEHESMLFQEFQENIQNHGEISLIMIGGKFTHGVLKKAKSGDFRVQDDFGGTVEDYVPTKNEIRFAENAIQACPILPIYGRVDIFYDNQNKLALGELELIEPELWFRKKPDAANILADKIHSYIQKNE